MYYGYIRTGQDENSAQIQRETIETFAEGNGFLLTSRLEIKSAKPEAVNA